MATPARVENLEQAPVPPQNLDAEESVLGALMLAGTRSGTFDAVLETGLTAADFYRESHGRIFSAQKQLHDRSEPVDAITVVEELQQRGQLDDVVTPAKIHELAALVPAASNAPHYARIVVDAAARRVAISVGNQITALAFDGAEPASIALRAEELVSGLTNRVAAGDELRPLWWHEAIHEPIPATSEYVEGVLQAGVLADIVGLPYLHKTAVALELATKVAIGAGELLGKFPIAAQANTAYFWSDDSRAKELERIQAYAKACGRDDVVPLAFYLNSGLTLPDGIPFLRAQIRRHGFKLVVLDSLYNFAPGLDWIKDTASVSLLYHHLKRLCDQIEGLTIVLVDHASKPSDSNRGRDASISSYGSVWKAAAVRSSIVITKDDKGLKATAIGNNISGFPPTVVVFDEQRLELRILDIPEPAAEEELDEIVLEEVRRKPGQSTNQIRENVGKRHDRVAATLIRLERNGLVYNAYGSASQLPGTTPEAVTPGAYDEVPPDSSGKRGKRYSWYPLNQAEKVPPDETGNTPEELPPGTVSEVPPATASESAPLYVVEGHTEAVPTDETDDIDWSGQ